MATGKVIQVIGPVVDIEFPPEQLPDIYNAVEIQRKGQDPLTCEVQQHLGNNWVRAVAMTTTDGLARCTTVVDSGGPISVPVGEVTLGIAPRLGQFGINKQNDAVEGVILMRRGEQTQNVLEGVVKKTQELNTSILPPDVKVRPFYDRSDLVRVTTDTVEWNLLRGMVLVLLVLLFFLVSFRAAVITARAVRARAYRSG